MNLNSIENFLSLDDTYTKLVLIDKWFMESFKKRYVYQKLKMAK